MYIITPLGRTNDRKTGLPPARYKKKSITISEKEWFVGKIWQLLVPV